MQPANSFDSTSSSGSSTPSTLQAATAPSSPSTSALADYFEDAPSPKVIAAQRRYSESITEWTNIMWNRSRADIERRASLNHGKKGRPSKPSTKA